MTLTTHGLDSDIRTYTGTLRSIASDMMSDLAIDGPRGLTAAESWDGERDIGRAVHVELYDGEDWIRDAAGRVRRDW